MIMGHYATEASIRVLEEKLGLNDPLHLQYWRWFSKLFRGDLGRSLLSDEPVLPLILLRFTRSLPLAVIVTVFTTIFGTALGVLTGIYKDTWVDYLSSTLTFVGISLPEFLWGILLILVVVGQLGWLPSSGYTPFAENPWKWVQHLVLPSVTLTITMLAHVTRLTRANMIDVLRRQYITCARSKGLSNWQVNLHHALRNALLPTVTVIAMNVGWLMGGIVVVEKVFAYPGLGRLMLQAIIQRDLPVIQGTILLSTFIYSLFNLIADLSYAYLDPRVMYTGSDT